MRPFTYHRPSDPAEAARLAAAHPGARFIAGGTNLLDLMKLQIETPGNLIDVNRLGLDRIEDTDEGGLRIGALVRNTDLAADQRIRRDYAVLARALLSGASAQLRNKATTAGNLLQRTRCSYFYDTTKPCNRRTPGLGCAAIGGFNRGHAIMGTSEALKANASPEKLGLSLASLASAVLLGIGGARWLSDQVDKNLLRATAADAANKPGSPDKAKQIMAATPAKALQIAKEM